MLNALCRNTLKYDKIMVVLFHYAYENKKNQIHTHTLIIIQFNLTHSVNLSKKVNMFY